MSFPELCTISGAPTQVHAALGGLSLSQFGGALAAGVNLNLGPETPTMFQRAGAVAQSA